MILFKLLKRLKKIFKKYHKYLLAHVQDYHRANKLHADIMEMSLLMQHHCAMLLQLPCPPTIAQDYRL